jgi:hypothetical protein
VKIYYAARSEYYWQTVAQPDYPSFFVGDSAGSTDYKMGLSMGRGLLATQYLASSIRRHESNFHQVATDYQTYWDNVVVREFNQGPNLTAEPRLQYLYFMQGREIVDSQLNHGGHGQEGVTRASGVSLEF